MEIFKRKKEVAPSVTYINGLEKDIRELEKDVFFLKNPPKYKYGDETEFGIVKEVREGGHYYNGYCWEYTIDNGRSLIKKHEFELK